MIAESIKKGTVVSTGVWEDTKQNTKLESDLTEFEDQKDNVYNK